VVAFLVENHPDVFTDKLKPQLQRRIFVPPCDSSSRSSTYSSVTSLQCNEGMYNLQLPSYRADGSAPTMNSLANHTIASSNAIDINKLRKNLSQLITSPSGNNQPYSPGHGHGQIDGESHYYHTNGSLDSSSNEVDPDGYGGNNNIHSMYATSYNIEDSPQVRTSLHFSLLMFHLQLLTFFHIAILRLSSKTIDIILHDVLFDIILYCIILCCNIRANVFAKRAEK
jgi:hypothetical protein